MCPSDQEEGVACGIISDISRGLFESRRHEVHVGVTGVPPKDVSSKVTQLNHVSNVYLRPSELLNPVIRSVPFNTQLFSKLGHPVEVLLRRLPRVNGLDVKQLPALLTDVITLRNVSLLSDTQLLVVIVPYCSGIQPFFSRTPRFNFSSTLYPQSCWCIIQVIHSL
jgi:hypothetical protein